MFASTRRGALIGALSAFSLAPGAAGASGDPRVEATNRLLAPWATMDQPGVAVAASLDGRTVYSRGHGLADLEQGTAIAPATVFRAASVSKQFTAFALMLLVAEGRASLDDPLSRHIPETAALGADLRLHHLVRHTGGVRDEILMQMAGWGAEDPVTDEQAERLFLRQRGLNFSPGSRFQYTNGGYFLLARIVERLSGQSLAAFCKARIFDPLDMADTRFEDDPERITPRRAEGYRKSRDGLRRAGVTGSITGPTGLLTTTSDLLRWAANFETGAIGGPKVMRLMAERESVGGAAHHYAGGQERHVYRGLETWSHGGREAGYRAFLLRAPSRRFSVAVLSNRSDFDMAKTAYDMADIWLAEGLEPARVSTPVAAPDRRRLDALTGDYELFPGIILSVTAGGDGLSWRMRGAKGSERLQALSDGAFLLDPKTDVRLEFAPPVAGRAPGLKYRLGMNGSLDAPRIVLQPFEAGLVDLAAYVGGYESDELDTAYRLFLKDGRLVARHPRLSDLPLTPYQPDVFASPQAFFGRAVFTRSPDGVVDGMVVSGAVAEGVRFVRTGGG
ncbi:serine hydrolase domain-containing protein [Caulobacter mirabilis]|uniref:Beta-lactamase-related domain-containing protein n=1 Tax=Caulobacter mirabilis TaxID=69666 RepID=A0A2D2B1C5_9CAUL|nr:serine hydrolase domain-containing protein [Caulobacter mirabilis]ATQ44064.1 hypothetical protein CSW64_17545 [Caulobacter mirabilis]